MHTDRKRHTLVTRGTQRKVSEENICGQCTEKSRTSHLANYPSTRIDPKEKCPIKQLERRCARFVGAYTDVGTARTTLLYNVGFVSKCV